MNRRSRHLWVLRSVAAAASVVAVVLLSNGVHTALADLPPVTGTFYANNHGIYYIQQSGSSIWWMGESASDLDANGNVLPPNDIWHRGIDSTSVFQGTISGNTVTGDWVEVNRGKSERTGTMTLAVSTVTDGLGTHLHLALAGGTSPNGDTDWLQGDQLNDMLYVYPDGHFEVVDFYNRFQLSHKSIPASGDESGDKLGDTHNPAELRPYRDQTVFYGTLERTGVGNDGCTLSNLCAQEGVINAEFPHVNVKPGLGFTYPEFACQSNDGDLDLRVRLDTSSLTTDYLSKLGWGNINASDEGESIAPGSDAQDVMPKLTSVGPFSPGAHLGAEGIMYGGDKVFQGFTIGPDGFPMAVCPSSANSLLPGWADRGGNSITVNGVPIDGNEHPENLDIEPNPDLAVGGGQRALAGLNGYPMKAAPPTVAPPPELDCANPNHIPILCYNMTTQMDPAVAQPLAPDAGTEVRVTGALVLDCGHADFDDVDTEYGSGQNCDQGEAFDDTDDQNAEIHTFYSLDLIECPLGYAPGYCDNNPAGDVAPADLTGAWGSNDGGTYYIREVGNDIWWAGLTRDRDPLMPAWTQFCFPIGGCAFFGAHDPIPNPTNVFHGTITRNADGTATITGDAITIPKGLEDGGAVTTATFTVGAKNKTMDLVSSSSPDFPWPVHFDKLYEPRSDSTTVTHVHDPAHTNVTGGSVPLGTAVHDSAEPGPVVCGGCIPAGPKATGTVTYRLFTTPDCTGASTDETVDVGTESTPQTLDLGSYSYDALYSGDVNYNSSRSGCEPFTISKITPGLTTSTVNGAGEAIGGARPVASGAAIHDSATISGQVSGYSVDDGATVTYAFYGSSNCSGSSTTQDVTVAADGTVPDSSPQTLAPGSYSYQATYNGDAGYTAVTSACEPFVVINPITDGGLCAFDVDTGTSGNQFKLIFTPDPTAPTAYKLAASNPGQIDYSAFGYSSSGTITLTIPYPFVTQGAVPIHIFDGVTVANVNGRTCLVPGDEIGTSTVQITPASYAPSSFGNTTTVSVPFASATGFAFAEIHLDYGLKKTTGYAKGGVTQSCNTAANDAVGSLVTVPDCQSYAFSQSDGAASSQAVSSRNVFKRDPGIAGIVLNSGGTPVANATVAISQGTALLPIAVVSTDGDGWYSWQYKYTGKATTFTVKLPAYNLAQVVTLKSNGFVVVNFAVP